MQRSATVAVLLVTLVSGVWLPAATQAIGGGLLDAGLVGRYWPNPDFSGEPAFQRRDIRIDFDWGTLRRPGGSLAWTALGSVPADDYSIRWQGGLMARFSETYDVLVEADSVRIWLKPSDQADFGDPLIDHWPASEADDQPTLSASLALVAGRRYDIRIDYRERSGTARMRLRWQSPSTPAEVIQPTAFVGEQPPGRSILAADAMWGASNWNDKDGDSADPLRYDADGWPTEDFGFLIRPQDEDLNPGTYLLRFNGQARVSVHLVNGERFASADGSVDFGDELDPGEGYDVDSNTTLARLILPDGAKNCWPNFIDTDRDGPGPAYGSNSGVTGLRLMRPTTLGSDQPHRLDELFARDSLDAMDRFVTYRWNDVNGDGDVSWADRKNLFGQGGSTNECHEYKILWCNHSGRDLWIQVPHRADDDYITKMAQLLRYGSDADGNSYTSDQAMPVHPPLNPNLRVYVEYTNECPWNTAGQYPQSHWVRQKGEDAIEAGDADGRILDYDGAGLTGFAAGKRYFALRSKQISDMFRSVFGDEAMPAPGRLDPRVRPVLMWQYDNFNGTAQTPLFFIDDYYNKTDPLSTYSGTPQPVGYYFWGAGAATYYASADRLGILPDHPFNRDAIGGFQTPVLAAGSGTVAPTGTSWTFTGSGGIYRQPASQAGTIGGLPDPTAVAVDHPWRGCRFTVGDSDVAVYQLGRYVHSAGDGVYQLAIHAADTDQRVARIEVDCRDTPAGSVAWAHTGTLNYIASRKFFSHPVILEAGRSYYLVSDESGGDAHRLDVPLTAPAGIRIDGTVQGAETGGSWEWITGGSPDRCHGPVNLMVASRPVATADGTLQLGFVQASKQDRDKQMRSNRAADYSDQAMFLAGTATAEVPISFPATGHYGLIYHLAYKRDQQPWFDSDGDGATDDEHGRNRPKVYLVADDEVVDISPAGQGSIRVGGWNYEGYWTKPLNGFDFFGSAPFQITDTSRSYAIRFVTGDESTDNVVFIDNVVLASVDQMLAGAIPSGGGFAEGQPDVSNWEARVMSQYTYGQSFGLHAMAYEGGWYPGGDANKMPLQFMASYFGEAIVTGERNAVETLARAGLAVATDYTRSFAFPDYDHANASSYSRARAWDQVHATLAPEATNGLPVASTLAESSTTWRKDGDRDEVLDQGDWFSWNVIVPASGLYRFRIESTSGGELMLLADDHLVILSGASGGFMETGTGVFLTKGLHSLRLKATAGSCELIGVAGAPPGQPYGPADVDAHPGNGQIYVTLPDRSDVDGFHVYYRTREAVDWSRHNANLIPPDRAGTLYVLDGLANDTTYMVVVTMVIDGEESGFSNEVTVVPIADAPMVSWEFDDSGDKTAVGCDFADPLLQPATLSIGSGFSSTANSFYQSDAFGVTGGDVTALDEEVYFETTIAPIDGAIVDLERLTFGGFSQRGGGEDYWALRWSDDGFVTVHDLALEQDLPITGTTLNSSSGAKLSADLRGVAELQRRSAAVTFRIYYWYGGDQSGGKGLGKLGPDADDVWFSGTTRLLGRSIGIGVDEAGVPIDSIIEVDQADAVIVPGSPRHRIDRVDGTRPLRIRFLPDGSG